jgi:hypothetical protein
MGRVLAGDARLPSVEQGNDRRADIILTLVALALGAAAAAGYAAWRAVSLDDGTSGERWSEFGEAMLFPGAIIIVAIAAVVVLGWKANIDD